jgi:hypothetical protein
MRRKKQQRGSAIIEFTLAGIASMLWLLATIQLAIGMWNYHTLAFGVHETTRYVAVKGVGCTKPGNTCSVTVGTIARKFSSVSKGIPSDQTTVTLTSDSGVQTTCAPLNTCFSDGTVWPPAANHDNHVGRRITVSARYQLRSALMYFWPGSGSGMIGSVWLPASSTQTILF